MNLKVSNRVGGGGVGEQEGDCKVWCCVLSCQERIKYAYLCQKHLEMFSPK